MTGSDFEKSLLALTCWRLAGGDGLDCMLAVGCCLANKVKAEKRSWLEIIGREMAWLEIRNTEAPSPLPDTREPTFVKLLQSVDTIYEGKSRDASNGATLYMMAGAAAPDGFALCARVGRWSFFRAQQSLDKMVGGVERQQNPA